MLFNETTSMKQLPVKWSNYRAIYHRPDKTFSNRKPWVTIVDILYTPQFGQIGANSCLPWRILWTMRFLFGLKRFWRNGWFGLMSFVTLTMLKSRWWDGTFSVKATNHKIVMVPEDFFLRIYGTLLGTNRAGVFQLNGITNKVERH